MLQASCFLSRQLGVYLQSLGLQPFQLLLLIYSGQQCACAGMTTPTVSPMKAGIQVLNCCDPNPVDSRPRSESRMTFLRGNDRRYGVLILCMPACAVIPPYRHPRESGDPHQKKGTQCGCPFKRFGKPAYCLPVTAKLSLATKKLHRLVYIQASCQLQEDFVRYLPNNLFRLPIQNADNGAA